MIGFQTKRIIKSMIYFLQVSNIFNNKYVFKPQTKKILVCDLQYTQGIIVY